MNGAHLHLVVNHLPVFGVAFGALALLWSIVRKSSEMRWAAILLFIFAAIMGWISSETGESAEEVVEHLPGVTEAFIHAHEEAAEFANILAAITAFGAVLLAGFSLKKPKLVQVGQYILLILAALTSTAMLRTANLGGQIRHTEIRDGAAAVEGEKGETGEDEEGSEAETDKD